MTRTGSLKLAFAAVGVLSSLCIQLVLQASTLIPAKVLLWLFFVHLRGPRDPTRLGDIILLGLSMIWELREYLGTIIQNPIFLFVLFATSAAVFVADRTRTSSRDFKPALPPPGSLKHVFQSPLIFRSRTTHSRLFPKKNSFSYSYLVVAIPVGFQGCHGSLLSVDTGKRAWLHIKGSDYLDRHVQPVDLKTKLSKYLQSQGVEDAEWSHAYLVTAPRWFGYAFNPASFWYIYDHDNALTMMIIEVNNTFGERRLYLLSAQSGPLEPSTLELGNKKEKKIFKNAWEKDFHVSPFNSRKGSYTLSAEDPFGGSRDVAGPINNTIVLKSSKEHGKIVARLFSNGLGIDPAALTVAETITFFAAWWWVGFMTFPRILKEAWKLYFARKLHVWFRPEVQRTSIGRSATISERDMETFFRRYITDAVERCSEPLRLKYQATEGPLLVIHSRAYRSLTSSQEIELKVLSPAFYTRFVHYSHTAEAFDDSFLSTDERNRTVWISSPEGLSKLFQNRDALALPPDLGPLEQLRWRLHTSFRRAPKAPAHANPNTSKPAPTKNTKPSAPSQLDLFVLEHCPDDACMYRRSCARLFLATRFGFGLPIVIDAADLVVRALVTFTLARTLLVPWRKEIRIMAATKAALNLASLLSLHAYSWVKGLSR